MDSLKMSNDAYVYAILVNEVVRYIGKGRNKRISDHIRFARNILKKMEKGEKIKTTNFYNNLCQALLLGLSIEEKIIENNLSDEEAYVLEHKLISSGTYELWNEMSGGIGPTSEDMFKVFQNPINKLRHLEGVNKLETKMKKSEAAKTSWDDPISRSKRIESLNKSWNNDERRKQTSINTKERFSNLDERVRHSDIMKEVCKRPEIRENRSKIMKQRYDDFDERVKHGDIMKEVCRRPEVKENKSKIMKIRYSNIEERIKLSNSVKEAKTKKKEKEEKEFLEWIIKNATGDIEY